MKCKPMKRGMALFLAFCLMVTAIQLVPERAGAAENVNLALAATATASVADDTNPATNMNDGRLGTRWAKDTADATTASLAWDSVQTIKSVVIFWERRNVTSLKLKFSEDGGTTWKENAEYSRSQVPDSRCEVITLANAERANKIQLEITHKSQDEDGAVNWASVAINELEVYASEYQYAKNKGVYAVASTDSRKDMQHAAMHSNDGDSSTGWISAAGENTPRWLNLCWGSAQAVKYIVLEWGQTNAEGYRLKTSTDGETWTMKYENASYPSDGLEVITLEEETQAKYLKLEIDKVHKVNGANGTDVATVNELRVFGADGESEVGAIVRDFKNLARRATATASNVENAANAIANINDGNRGSRWAHGQASSAWVRLEWSQPQTFAQFRIIWERLNANAFYLEKSDDGSDWTKITKTFSNPENHNFEITLSRPVTAKYLRLNVADIADRVASDTVTWRAVSVWELEAYAAGDLVHEDGAQEINGDLEGIEGAVAGIEAPEIQEGKISMPQIEGASTRFCADYEEVIGEDGTIYAPLEQKTVKGYYEVTEDSSGEVLTTKEFTVSVPGTYTAAEGDNAKPPVIPELQEWHGETGEFLAGSASRIIVTDGGLKDTADIFAEDYKELTGLDISVVSQAGETASAGDFVLSLAQGSGLGKEGYFIEIDDAVTVSAEQATGAYWATRTILQVLKQTNGTMPKGQVRDYPKYEVRGFSLDVGRKPFTLDAVRDYAKNMSWYKLNSFQVHLNDNLIFHEDYGTIEEAKEQSYAAFRLESGVINEETGKSATSEDVFYTKDEFREFVQESRKIGIDVVPELDMPAHALAFTRAFPEFMSDKAGGQHSYLIEELDLDKDYDGALDLAKRLWSDYFEGDDPVFDEETTIHIGTDEFHGNTEKFRKFTDDMIAFVQDTGRDVRMWGSLSTKRGTTPVRTEGVQLNVWNAGWSVPKDMYEDGFELINTLDSPLYMVPNGNGNRGGYGDYLNKQHIYENWVPNNLSDYVVPAGSDQMLGACYAVWHDNIDTRANGISQLDSFIRFHDALPAFSAKLWGEGSDRTYSEFEKKAEETGTAPGTEIYGEVESPSSLIADYQFEDSLTEDSGINGFDLKAPSNAGQAAVTDPEGKALKLKGGASYIETPDDLDQVGGSAVLAMRVKMDEDAEGEQILCESKTECGAYGTYAFKASQRSTGKVGFSREGYDFSFDYELPKGEWHELAFCSGANMVSLYVDGELIDSDPEIYFANHPDTELSAMIQNRRLSKVATMLVPLGRIGSKTKSFKGEIDFVTVSSAKEISGEYGKLNKEQWTVSACSTATDSSTDYAYDGNSETFWHQNYANDALGNTAGKDTLHPGEPHWFEIELPEEKMVCKLTYLPRQNQANGRIHNYSIVVTDAQGVETTVVSERDWAQNNTLKTAEFDPVPAKKVKLVMNVTTGDNVGRHATIADLNLYEALGIDSFKAGLRDALQRCEAYKAGEYTEITWGLLDRAMETARLVLASESDDVNDYISAKEQLEAAEEGLATRSADRRLFDLVKESGQKKAADYAKTGFDAYLEKVNEAKALSESATEDQKKAAAEAIETARGALVYIGELRAVLESALNESLDDYMQDANMDAYQDAMNDADQVIKNADATKQDVKDALAALREARENLVPDVAAIARRELAEAIRDAEELLEGIDESDYTEESVTSLRNAVNEAKGELNNADATAERFGELKEAILNARLVTKKDDAKEKLRAAIADAEATLAEINRDDYTADSVKNLEDAIREAKAELEKADATAETLAEKLAALDVSLVPKDPEAAGKKEELRKAVKEAEKKLEGWRGEAYTEDSVQKLQAALTAAREEIANSGATAETLAEKLAALEGVVLVPKNLEIFEAKESLETEIASAEQKLEEIVRDDYTADSVKNLEDAIREAKAELEKADATAETLAEKLAALDVSLVPKDPEAAGKKEELREAVKEAEKKLEGWRGEAYTEDSLKKLQAALTAAREEIANSGATAETLAEKLAVLEGVVLVPKNPELFESKDSLDKEIEKAQKQLAEIDRSNYTPESVEALESAVSKALEEMEKEGATADSLNLQLAALKGVRLETKAEAAKRAALKTAADNAFKGLSPSGYYTAASYRKLQAAVSAARKLVASGATEKELADAANAIAAAKRGLALNAYRVSFNSNGGSAVAAKTVKAGQKVAAPASPTRAGYAFGGWYANAACTAKYNFAAAVTKNVTLYAKWTKVSKDGATMTDKKKKITYKIVSEEKKTAMVVKGTNKKATSVKIPAQVTIEGVKCKVVTVGAGAFKGYNKMTKAELGKNVATIEKNAFSGCKKLKTVTLKGKALKTVKGGAFKGTSKSLTFKAPKGMKKAAKNKLLRNLKKGGNKKIKVK